MVIWHAIYRISSYLYDVIQDAEIPVGGPSLFNAHLFSNDWKNAFLQGENLYKKSGSNYQLIKKSAD